MALARAMSCATTSRVWSCETLREGLDHVASEAKQLEEEERKLEQKIKDIRGPLSSQMQPATTPL